MSDRYDIDPRAFGRHVRKLRTHQGLTQKALAKRAELSADTILRLEAGTISPSLNTLVALSRGLELRLVTVLESLDVGELGKLQELLEFLGERTEEELVMVLHVVRVLLD